MNNTSSVIRFCISALCVLLILTYTSIKGLFYTDNGAVSAQTASVATPEQTQSEQTETQNENTNTEQNASPAESAESVAVSATGVVKGAVIERFISPYTANTSYNGVYLKNNTELNINLLTVN